MACKYLVIENNEPICEPLRTRCIEVPLSRCAYEKPKKKR